MDAETPQWLQDVEKYRAQQPRSVVFLCVANSARSQMAEGLARALAPEGLEIHSAGSAPTLVHPLARRAMAEIGIDISSHRSKNLNTLDWAKIDVAITLCDGEVCPHSAPVKLRLHWSLPDPAAMPGSDVAKLEAFRQVRDELQKRIHTLFETSG